MKVELTDIDGVFLIRPDVYRDHRGFFMETYSYNKYSEYGVTNTFIQDNHSHSVINTFRGLHYQLKNPQGKLVRVLKGAVIDIVLDIRLNSPTFGKCITFDLDDKDFLQIYLPPGMAHGFYVKSEFTDFEYKCTNYYFPEDQNGVSYKDTSLHLDFIPQNAIISDQDESFLSLNSIPESLLPKF